MHTCVCVCHLRGKIGFAPPMWVVHHWKYEGGGWHEHRWTQTELHAQVFLETVFQYFAQLWKSLQKATAWKICPVSHLSAPVSKYAAFTFVSVKSFSEPSQCVMLPRISTSVNIDVVDLSRQSKNVACRQQIWPAVQRWSLGSEQCSAAVRLSLYTYASVMQLDQHVLLLFI